MKHRAENLCRELREGVTRDRLKELSVDIIDRYKRKDLDGLRRYAALIDIVDSSLAAGRLFAAVIQRFHPDKIAVLRRELDTMAAAGDTAGLERMREIYLSDNAIPRAPDQEFEYEEEFSYEDDEFGYTERSEFDDNEPQASEFEEEYAEAESSEGYGFVEAVNGLLFGNLDFSVDDNDLAGLEGELDLSDFEITDLDGVEYCVNVTMLNLSGNLLRRIGPLALLRRLTSLFLADNAIENIDCLGELSGLRELDISFNRIEDISVLEGMETLVYVNVLGNPLADMSTVERLMKRGVIVIY